MKRFARALLLCSAVIGLASGCSVNQAFVRGVDGYAKTILPEYDAYIDKDPALSPDTKKLRKETAIRFRALIEEAKKE